MLIEFVLYFYSGSVFKNLFYWLFLKFNFKVYRVIWEFFFFMDCVFFFFLLVFVLGEDFLVVFKVICVMD